jgi:hypothetical protein
MLGVPNDWYRWDELRRPGNHKLVQLTAVVPVVGYLILLNKELARYYALYFDADSLVISYRLYCLYFGFTFLGVASILFNFLCPKLVKEYGSAAAFVAAEERISDRARIRRMMDALIGERFKEQFPNARYTLEQVRAVGGAVDWAAPIPFARGTPDFHNEAAYLQQLKRDHDDMAAQIVDSPGLVMTHYFVPLKDENRAGRFAVFVMYVLGFAVLAIPTIEVFVRVLRGLVG